MRSQNDLQRAVERELRESYERAVTHSLRYQTGWDRVWYLRGRLRSVEQPVHTERQLAA